jgi:hypothetical protein
MGKSKYVFQGSRKIHWKCCYCDKEFKHTKREAHRMYDLHMRNIHKDEPVIPFEDMNSYRFIYGLDTQRFVSNPLGIRDTNEFFNM